jgi:carnitine O-acetyltransferase
MGGYGFFDAGMLLSALKNLNEDRGGNGEKPLKKRLVGKRLQFNEY